MEEVSFDWQRNVGEIALYQQTRIQIVLTVLVMLSLFVKSVKCEETLQPLVDGRVPRSVEELWVEYDPRKELLHSKIVREWKEDGVVFRSVVYTIGTFKGKQSRMAAFYGFPENVQEKLPAVMHIHGGGQRANMNAVRDYALRGYVALSVNWGGREMERAKPGDPNTDWGAIDPTQNNVAGYSSLLPGARTIDAVESPRNNNWFLLTIGCRRGITFLEQQPEVDKDRIGIWGHSMGGRLTGLVAGSDRRVKVASPSVGGSGFLQTDLWGLPGSARRVRGDLELFQKTLAGEAYLSRVSCPFLFLSATNDFNAPMEFVERGMALVPHDEKRTAYAVHLNHRFTPEADVSRRLWFDEHLQGRFTFPKSPRGELILKQDDGVPVYRVMADSSRRIERVDVYYGYERDPRNRFWADAVAQRAGDVWVAKCPVYDLSEPLFVLANVSYRLTEKERRLNDPETFVLSVSDSVYPDALMEAGVQKTGKQRRLIDDFSRGIHDWYVLNGKNRHHWFFSTRKLADPRWTGPRGGELVFEVITTEANNTLGIQIETNAWRGYARRKKESYVALVKLPDAGKQEVQLRAGDFVTSDGKQLTDWEEITELSFRAGDKPKPEDKLLGQWAGEIPKFSSLRWVGGEVIERSKPFLPSR